MPRIFLSFASEDADFVLPLFDRLKKLDLDVWDYTNRDEEISLGDSIPDTLRQRILESDYFIPIISSNSVSKTKTMVHLEVKFALTNSIKILPLVLLNRAPSIWDGVFEQLSDRRFLEFQLNDEKDFENKIISLCGYIKIEYKPLVNDHYKLPLFNKLEKELKALLSTYKKLNNRAEYEKIMSIVQLFNLSYSLGEWEKSLEHISYLITFIKYETGATLIYYPLIVKGACELTLNKLDNAEATFLEAVKLDGADENAEGGLAHVYFKQKKYKDAFLTYKKALVKCSPECVVEIEYNLLLTAIELVNNKDELNLDKHFMKEVYQIINNCESSLKELNGVVLKERVQINYLKAVAFSRINNFKKSLEIFETIFKPVANLPNSLLSELNKQHVSLELHQYFINTKLDIPFNHRIFHPCNRRSTNIMYINDEESIYIFKKRNTNIDLFYTETTFILDYSDLLDLLNNKNKALDLLLEYSAFTDSRNLYQRLAMLNVALGNIDAVKEIFETKLCIPPYDRQLLIEYALILRKLDLHSKMTKICDQVINLGNPVESLDWYYHGFAFYLQGQSSKARIFYNGGDKTLKYYSNLV